MDIKRTILLVALAVVSYVLVLQWNQDYGQAAAPVAQSNVASNTVSDVPDAQTSAVHDDVPVAEQTQPHPNQVADVAVGDRLIRVRTDVLDLAINPVGGDIVQLNLPQYPRQLKNPDVPFQLFDNRNGNTYLAQSGLVGDNAPDSRSGRARWSSAASQYQLAEGQDQLVVDLHYANQGVNYTKRFTFAREAYDLKVEYLIDNQSGQAWRGTPYAQLKRDGSSDPSSTTATSATYLGAAIWTADEPYKKVSMGDLDDNKLPKTTVQGGWVAWLQHYFVTAWIPAADSTNVVSGSKDSQGNYIVGFTGETLSVPAGSQGVTALTLYAGPKIQEDLKALAPGLDLTVDYGILWFLAQPIFWLLELIHDALGNWGWSIIVLTILIKLIFFPLSAASYKSMARMRAVSPKLQALKELHGDDRQKMSQAMMELYKKEKINPLGGCLPILVQMPVFLALYWVLLESVEMRQAPWMLWITDLSSTDQYFILPIIMGVTMFIQQQLNPTPPDPMQARVMKLLPIIFTFFFLWFPAGLVLYWVVNNILSIAQQWYITRQIEAAAK